MCTFMPKQQHIMILLLGDSALKNLGQIGNSILWHYFDEGLQLALETKTKSRKLTAIVAYNYQPVVIIWLYLLFKYFVNCDLWFAFFSSLQSGKIFPKFHQNLMRLRFLNKWNTHWQSDIGYVGVQCVFCLFSPTSHPFPRRYNADQPLSSIHGHSNSNPWGGRALGPGNKGLKHSFFIHLAYEDLQGTVFLQHAANEVETDRTAALFFMSMCRQHLVKLNWEQLVGWDNSSLSPSVYHTLSLRVGVVRHGVVSV